MAKTYIVYRKEPKNSTVLIKEFRSHEEALNYSLTLMYDVIIYESVTSVTLCREVEDIE